MSNRIHVESQSPRRDTPGPNIALYDLARWKPINADKMLDELAFMYSTPGSTTTVVATEDLDDGRQRIVYYAEVMRRPSREEVTEPYFMILVDPDDRRARPTCFVRTDVDLPVDLSVGAAD